MAISETDKLKNNDDLTQHFLYTYSNIAKLGPQEKIRKMFNEDLIFDRSRKSIFTQSQEFGYVSDTVYTLSVGNDKNEGNTYVTLRSYEGRIEIYNYTPLKLHSIQWDSSNVQEDNNTYLFYNTIFNPEGFKITYSGNSKPSVCNIYVNSEKVTFTSAAGTLLSGSGVIYINKLGLKQKVLRGHNVIKAEVTSSYTTYFNDVPELMHQTFPRYQQIPIETTDIVYAYFETANPVNVLLINNSYWEVFDNPNLVTINNSTTIDTRLTEDYYKTFHDDHAICENEANQVLCLTVPKTLEERNKIYGFVGGTSTEFYKLKTSTYCGEDYNFYIGTGNNWNGQDLWFQKKTLKKK